MTETEGTSSSPGAEDRGSKENDDHHVPIDVDIDGIPDYEMKKIDEYHDLKRDFRDNLIKERGIEDAQYFTAMDGEVGLLLISVSPHINDLIVWERGDDDFEHFKALVKKEFDVEYPQEDGADEE